MEINKKCWNEGQKTLRQALSRVEDSQWPVELFLRQHAMVHSAEMSQAGLWSFADEVLDGLGEDDIRCIPARCDHSIAWILWHLARIEDVTMNLLIAGTAQVFQQENWCERLNVQVIDTGNASSPTYVADLSATIDVAALRSYRCAVGQRTREVVRQIPAQDLKRKPSSERLQRVLAEGALVPAAIAALDFWGGLSYAGLLLMPPTRHCFIHWNEALKVRRHPN